MERQAYYFARIEVAVEGLRAGVKHPALHELLDIVDEARFCLEGMLPPVEKTMLTHKPVQFFEPGTPGARRVDDIIKTAQALGEASARKIEELSEITEVTAGPYSAASKEQERARRTLAADLQEVIDRAGCTNIPDAVAEILQCDVQPGVILRALDCTLAEFAALRDGKADAELARKFLAVFKLKSEKEA